MSDADGHTGSTARIARPCLRQNKRSRPPVSVRPQEIARRPFYQGTSSSGKYGYARTTNGGSQWVSGDILIDGQPLTGQSVAMQPTVAGAGPLYAEYVHDGGNSNSAMRLRFIVGMDIDNPGNGGMTFDRLYASEGVPLELTLRHPSPPALVDQHIPGNIAIRSVPWLLADPTNADRLFLVYHTTKANSWTQDQGHANFDIYAQVIERENGYWQFVGGDPDPVNDDETLHPSDQFIPSPTVDEDGRLHIIWYDDRLYNTSTDQADGGATPDPKFDVYYARGELINGTLTFVPNEHLYGTGVEAGQPALDYALLHAPDPSWEFPDRPGEYNGIGVDGDTVWTTFTGTSVYDDSEENNPNVIWSSLIHW